MSSVSELFPYHDPRTNDRLVNPEILPNGVILAESARGLKPKVWTTVLLRPSLTNQFLDGRTYGGNIRKGRGWRWEGLWVTEFWHTEKSTKGEFGFPTHEQARDFLKQMGTIYG